MAVSKTRRQHRMAELISGHAVRSQSELVSLLAQDNIVATQATVSRDLDEMGAIKVRGPQGTSVYALPEIPFASRGSDDHLARVLGDWVVSIATSANQVVIRTPPGSAHVVGSALDRAGLEGVLGNVSGDDTVLVIASETLGGATLGSQLRRLAGIAEREDVVHSVASGITPVPHKR